MPCRLASSTAFEKTDAIFMPDNLFYTFSLPPPDLQRLVFIPDDLNYHKCGPIQLEANVLFNCFLDNFLFSAFSVLFFWKCHCLGIGPLEVIINLPFNFLYLCYFVSLSGKIFSLLNILLY